MSPYQNIAVIFDMDGVISNTHEIQAEVEAELLKEGYGITIRPELIPKKYAGLTTRDFLLAVSQEYNIKLDVDSLLREKWQRTYQVLKEKLQPIPGSLELITRLYTNNIRLSVASGTPLTFIKTVLSELRISDKFYTLVGGDEVTKGKPEPDIFLLCSERLGIKPEYCLVIEDGKNGMTAAKRANMKCIGLIKESGEYPADITVKHLSKISLEMIIELIYGKH